MQDKITRAIEDCDLFVVLWSKNAEASGWVSQEVGRAGALKKTILPLVLTEGLSLPGFLSNLKYIPVYKNPELSVSQAREIIISSYNHKCKNLATIEAKKQKDKEALTLMGIGAFILWAMNK
ncbi:toll/interleukin-1 receptor domain-containing protein [Porticoccus sp.]